MRNDHVNPRDLPLAIVNEPQTIRHLPEWGCYGVLSKEIVNSGYLFSVGGALTIAAGSANFVNADPLAGQCRVWVADKLRLWQFNQADDGKVINLSYHGMGGTPDAVEYNEMATEILANQADIAQLQTDVQNIQVPQGLTDQVNQNTLDIAELFTKVAHLESLMGGVNYPPQFDVQPFVVSQTATSVILEYTASDPEGDVIAHDLSIDAGVFGPMVPQALGNGVFRIEIFELTTAAHSFVIRLGDGTSTVDSNVVNVTLVVAPVNQSPVVSGLSATGTTTNENYKGSSSDTEGNAITGLWIQKRPAGAADWTAGNGMVEHKYESVDSSEVAEATAFKSASGLNIAGTYPAGTNWDFRVCAMDSGSGVYGAWVESLFASGGGFRNYFRDDFDDDVLDTTKFGTSINGSATIVEANGMLTGTLGTNVADAGIVFYMDNIVKGQVKRFRRKVRITKAEDASVMFGLIIIQKATQPSCDIQENINIQRKFYMQFRGTGASSNGFFRIGVISSTGERWYSQTNGWVSSITGASDSPAFSIGTDYIIEFALSETGITCKIMSADDVVIFSSTEWLWSDITDNENPFWIYWGEPYNGFYANWSWESDFFEVI